MQQGRYFDWQPLMLSYNLGMPMSCWRLFPSPAFDCLYFNDWMKLTTKIALNDRPGLDNRSRLIKQGHPNRAD
jgi:hypothetical protein